MMSWPRLGSVLVAVLTSGALLGCASQSEPTSSPAASEERPVVWAEAEAVWVRYVQHLERSEGAAAAALSAEAGLQPFSRYRGAALLLEQEELLRMRPEDAVRVLQLRAIASAAEVEGMTERDVFVALANAGLLREDLPGEVHVGRQREDGLFLGTKEHSLASPSFLVGPEGPRILSANAEFEKRKQVRARLGLSMKDVPAASPEQIANEAAHGLKVAPNAAWWTPLRPMAAELRQQGRATLESSRVPPGQKDSTQPSASAKEPVKGRLDPRVIQQKVREMFEAVRVCYEDGLARDPHLDGRVVVAFVIERDGRVSALQHQSDLHLTDVAECTAVQFYTLQFPNPDGGIVTVTYPIRLSPG